MLPVKFEKSPYFLNTPRIHGDGPELNGSWVWYVLQERPNKNREPDQKVPVTYMRATIYWKSTQRYYSLQAGKKKENGAKWWRSFRVAALWVAPLASWRTRVCPNTYIIGLKWSNKMYILKVLGNTLWSSWM